jgi:NAD-dependent dihydropyrimidine dehydrogenase PreA subunit
MTPRRIPREKIPWHPAVDPAKCTGCRACFEFCQHGVYEWDEAAGRPVVAKPLNCLVGCSGCEPKCPAGAISFPDMDEISELIRKLRAQMRDGA